MCDGNMKFKSFDINCLELFLEFLEFHKSLKDNFIFYSFITLIETDIFTNIRIFTKNSNSILKFR